ncbi:serine/threonine-protein phosphatase CPPED1-like isoform X1 [Homalodisca vitripennis]|uniref:serine/threonine-protein phosphatase CPPED1-like isoform X1 n=1 Tax=Homalodisca vitripennis TaxID=197043 RepID=UPI001EEA896B|nr:serine/threonine-protein phosphatase CPPED1-like isoform X1 [Homalodisca vitripennis]XP_046664305.1 serine/threonine-protein phosphatase CPPED1-like isoform X1 [Homalodisca vitripennis]XP_046664306.1 serine/threonine-protein phosphatase CPPED1-like isoform X1 [Homalodisca vitripennis]
MSWTIKGVNRTHTDFPIDQNKEWKEPFIFVQGADTQLGMFQDYEEITTEPKWAQEIALAELAVQKVNQMKPRPKFYVICGDLCHAFYDKSPEERAAQDADFKRIFSKVDPSIAVVCVCGNHDVGDKPTVEIIDKYKSNYGDDYFSFYAGGVFFICINSQLYHSTSAPEENEAHDQWLNTQLDIARGLEVPSIMFQHVPWFHTDPERTVEDYFEIDYTIRKKMLDKLVDAGVKYVFCGHLHKNGGGKYKQLECVVTSAIGKQLGTDLSGMRVVKVYKDRVEHQYYPLSEIPAEITL